jgi:predicted alpha/beta superfamily hydrolase
MKRCLFILMLSCTTLAAQKIEGKPFVLGTVLEIKSKVLSETRTLNIYLPESYKTDTARRFPVIYLLDGSENEDFIHIVGLVQFLTMIQVMPNSLVVGIANVDRRRDFTFPTTIEKDKKAYPTTGHSAQFSAFVEKELMPFVNHTYRTNDTTTIIGQSLGGLFATEILIQKPRMFTNYILVSPSLWWDNESLLLKARALRDTGSGKLGQVVICVGSEGSQMVGDAIELEAILKKHFPANAKIVQRSLPEESHLTILHRAVYLALEQIYSKH